MGTEGFVLNGSGGVPVITESSSILSLLTVSHVFQ